MFCILFQQIPDGAITSVQVHFISVTSTTPSLSSCVPSGPQIYTITELLYLRISQREDFPFPEEEKNAQSRSGDSIQLLFLIAPVKPPRALNFSCTEDCRYIVKVSIPFYCGRNLVNGE